MKYERVAIYQPNIFPPMHYVNRILQSDLWVMLDDVQLNRKVGQASFDIMFEGKRKRIALPVQGGNRVKINEATFDYAVKEFVTLPAILKQAYGKAPYFKPVSEWVFGFLEIGKEFKYTFEGFTECFMHELLYTYFKWKGDVTIARHLATQYSGSERMAAITELVNGTAYVCGEAGYSQYIVPEDFRKHEVNVLVQNWIPVPYKQFSEPFVANLSVLDALFHLGFEGTKEMLMKHGIEGWKEYSF